MNLRGEPTATFEQKGGAAVVFLFSAAGLVAGLITAGLVYPIGRLSSRHHEFARYILGGPLGATLAASLSTCKALRGFVGLWKALLLVAASIAAYFVSFWAAAGVELTFHREGSAGQAVSYSHLTLFTGGFVGGVLVLGGVPLLVYPKRRCPTLPFMVLVASVLCGILAVIGWILGPSLGTQIWSALHALGGTPPTETFQNALYGETSRQFSLFVIWQTGTAFLLGCILRARGRDRAESGQALQN